MSENDESMSKKKYILLASVALLGLALSLYAGSMPATPPPPKVPLPAVLNPTVIDSVNHKLVTFSFPYSRPGVKAEILDFNFQVDYKLGESTMFHIIPDDCVDVLEINGKKIELTGEAQARHCDWQHGFKMDWKPYLSNGVNKVHIVIRNLGGPTGLGFMPVEP